MPIGIERLLKLVDEQGLVSNLSSRELENPEGAGLDLRVGEVYQIRGGAFLGVEKRKTPEIKLIAKYDPKRLSTFTLSPNDYMLVKTLESVKLPVDIAGYTFARTTLFRSGIQFLSTQINPGYEGELTFGMKNIGSVKVTFELGARIAHVQFDYVDGGGNAYRGQWQGGRVSTQGKMEKQV